MSGGRCPVYFCLSASHLRFPVTEDEISRSVARFVAGWLVVTISGQLVTNIVTSSTMDPPPLNPDPGKPKRLRLSASLESKFGPRVRPETEAGRENEQGRLGRSASETRRGRRARTLSYEVKVSSNFCGKKAPIKSYSLLNVPIGTISAPNLQMLDV